MKVVLDFIRFSAITIAKNVGFSIYLLTDAEAQRKYVLFKLELSRN